MPVAQKFVGGIVMIALITTMILPGRQTPQVINAFAGGATQVLKASMATG